MKTRNKIVFAIFVIVLGFLAFLSFYIGLDVFNVNTLFYLPSIMSQIIKNEGNGIICLDACGPCSAWGYNYVLVEGQCKIPDKVEDCYYIDPPMEWEFVDGKCVPTEEYREKI